MDWTYRDCLISSFKSVDRKYYLITVTTFILLIHFCQSQINLSQFGIPSQSSTYYWKSQMIAELAITGGPTNDFNSESCTHTDLGKKIVWWQLNFTRDVYISNVIIYYRSDTPGRLAGYSLYLSNSTTITKDAYLCFHDAGPGLPNITQNVTCDHLGTHIIIFNERNNKSAMFTGYSPEAVLELCDVQIYGCYKGMYGKNCSSTCPRKCVEEHCYPGNGNCIWGCNCLHNNCDNVSSCYEGCKAEYAGDNCLEYNLASSGNTNGKQTINGKEDPANFIKDGNRSYCRDIDGVDFLFQVDMGREAVIKLVYIYVKNGSYAGFDLRQKLYISNSSNFVLRESALNMTYEFNAKFPAFIFQMDKVVIGKHVSFHSSENNPSTPISICEIEVIGCPLGHYGQYCQYTCPKNCLGSCHPDSGQCVFGCNDGWEDEFCNSSCKSPNFGKNCKQLCNCANEAQCNHINGTCPNGGCQKGWEGDSCSRECKPGYYDANCNKMCNGCIDHSCDRFEGMCNITGACNPGWFGTNCKQMCGSGSFGNNCLEICHCLKDSPSCHHVNGLCPPGGCLPGYKGDSCNTECSVGHYGSNCNELCSGCIMNECDKKNGNCLQTQGCKSGWKPEHIKCDIACDDGYFGDCTERCHCREGFCNKETGLCPLNECDRGWKGTTCSDECDDGQYGFNCESNCETCSRSSCEKIVGNCTYGCIAGYLGHQCLIKASSDDSFPSAAVGGIVGSVVIVLLVGSAIVFIRRRRRNKYKDTTKGTLYDANVTTGNQDKQKRNEYANITFGESSTDPSDNSLNVEQSKREQKTQALSVQGQAEHIYGNISKVEHRIPITELSTVIEQKFKNEEFEKEYQLLPKGSMHPYTEGLKEKNVPKNRFKNNWPYDHSRVILKNNGGKDYINANYIDSYSKKSAYIATQGPKKNTINDFWHMVWQEDVEVIVMVTKLEEGQAKKCDQYWPDPNTAFLNTPKYIVSSIEETERTVYVYRRLQISEKGGKTTREVHHYHFTQWPDHGVPDKIKLVKFYRKVNSTNKSLNGPMVVHCSAGVGRTGTFIAIDALYENGMETGFVDIMEYVQMMRKDRMNMIQTQEQYTAVFEALLEVFTVPDTSIKKDNFCNFFEDQQSGSVPENRKSIKLQFQKLQEIKPIYSLDSFCDARSKENIDKNAFDEIHAHNSFRPFLMSHARSSTNYINAVIIPGNTIGGNYLVTQYPLKCTVEDFWAIVYDNGCTGVVLLEKIDKFIPVWPSAKDSFDLEVFKLRQLDSDTDSVNLQLIHKPNKESRNIKIFVMDEWTSEKLPGSAKGIMEFCETVSSWRNTRKCSVAVVCRDGCSKSGLFVALSLALERLNMDDEIDIFQDVRSIQKRRPEFFTDFAQYEFCYQCIKEHLQNDDHALYANM